MRTLFLISFIFSGLLLVSWRDLSQTKIPQIDPSMRSYEMRTQKRVDTFDFAEIFPNLDVIDINAQRLRRVALNLTGEFPILKSVALDGGFGEIKGEFTGLMPKLKSVSIASASASYDFDLRGQWVQDVHLCFKTTSGNVCLTLPKDVAVVVNTKTTTGKVRALHLEKKGWGVWKKRFESENLAEAPIVLTIDIEVSSGNIILN